MDTEVLALVPGLNLVEDAVHGLEDPALDLPDLAQPPRPAAALQVHPGRTGGQQDREAGRKPVLGGQATLSSLHVVTARPKQIVSNSNTNNL